VGGTARIHQIVSEGTRVGSPGRGDAGGFGMEHNQGITLVTLAPTGVSWLRKYVLLRWVLRYRPFRTATRRFLGRSEVGSSPAEMLEALNFIHFGRWIVLQRHPWRRPHTHGLCTFDTQPPEDLDYDILLFTSNFDDEWRAYVDTFMEAVEDGLGVFWNNMPGWQNPTAIGYEEFFGLVDNHSVPHDHYYSAFPGFATADIKAALSVDRRVRSFDLTTRDYTNAAWVRAYGELIVELQHSLGTIKMPSLQFPTPLQFGTESDGHVAITSLAPLPVGDAPNLRREIRRIMGGGISPFARVQGTHFARLAVIDEARNGDDTLKLASAYLLISVDADGSPGTEDAWVRKLYDSWTQIVSGDPPGSLIDHIWGSCYGFGKWRTRDEFVDLIARTSFPATVPFVDYPSTSLWDIHRALHTHEWFTDFAFSNATGASGRKAFNALMAQRRPVSPP
jgi:hypothetical protein